MSALGTVGCIGLGQMGMGLAKKAGVPLDALYQQQDEATLHKLGGQSRARSTPLKGQAGLVWSARLPYDDISFKKLTTPHIGMIRIDRRCERP